MLKLDKADNIVDELVNADAMDRNVPVFLDILVELLMCS